jgi:hypothetical protein
MKQTSFTASVHKCSKCEYWSLQKPPVTNHVKAKCIEASVITMEKVVTHRDTSYECNDVCTLHQCSGCGYTSSQASSVKKHVAAKCNGAQVLSEKRKLTLDDVHIFEKGVELVIDDVYDDDSAVEGPALPPGGITRYLQGVERMKQSDSVQRMFYMIIPKDCPFIKFGITTGSVTSLRTRYNTYYGMCNIDVHFCDDHVSREKLMKRLCHNLGLHYLDRKELARNCDKTIGLYQEICRATDEEVASHLACYEYQETHKTRESVIPY